MANTYELIAKNVLTGSSTTITFSSIPSTYTDFTLRFNARTDIASTSGNVFFRFNSVSTTTYSDTLFYGQNATAGTSRDSNVTYLYVTANAANALANTFSNTEIYVPNYTVAQNKPSSSFIVRENNVASSAYEVSLNANLWRNTGAISTITLTTDGTSNFVSGSAFYLYGIKKS